MVETFSLCGPWTLEEALGQREIPARTMLCLEVMEERGLISLAQNTGRIRITINRVEKKVDLQASEILCRLREALGEG